MIAHLQDSIKQANVNISRSFRHGSCMKESLDFAVLNKILNILRYKAKLNSICKLSGHSFRDYAAVKLLYEGVPLNRVMCRGGCKPKNNALRYLRNGMVAIGCC